MTDYKIILGAVAAGVGIVGYAWYLRDVLRGRTKPHIFSWIVWSIFETISFFAQISKGGGAGTWVSAASALCSISIVIFAFRNSDKQIKPLDVVAFSGAIVGIALWRLTGNPLTAVILISISDALGFVPTFRKSFHKPHDETLIEYSLSTIKWILGILALSSRNLTTALYPASLILTNSVFVIMSLVRRKQLR